MQIWREFFEGEEMKDASSPNYMLHLNQDDGGGGGMMVGLGGDGRVGDGGGWW